MSQAGRPAPAGQRLRLARKGHSRQELQRRALWVREAAKRVKAGLPCLCISCLRKTRTPPQSCRNISPCCAALYGTARARASHAGTKQERRTSAALASRRVLEALPPLPLPLPAAGAKQGASGSTSMSQGRPRLLLFRATQAPSSACGAVAWKGRTVSYGVWVLASPEGPAEAVPGHGSGSHSSGVQQARLPPHSFSSASLRLPLTSTVSSASASAGAAGAAASPACGRTHALIYACGSG